jgi:hypothetical protein
VLTTLTTSFCLDVMGMKEGANLDTAEATRSRHVTHIAFAVLLLLVILGFRLFDSPAIIDVVLKLATYTYGPLLGLFGFGLISKRCVVDAWIPAVCIASPILCYVMESNSARWFGGYHFGFELLMLNGALTALMLLPFLVRHPNAETSSRR